MYFFPKQSTVTKYIQCMQYQECKRKIKWGPFIWGGILNRA